MSARFRHRAPVGWWLAVPAALAAAATGCSGGSSATTTSGQPSPTATSTPSLPPLPALAGRLVYRQFTDPSDTTAALWVSAPDGTAAHQVTAPSQGQIDAEPQWSPDGRHVVFTRNTPCSGAGCVVSDIYVVNSDGTGLRQLTREPRGVGCSDAAPVNACNSTPAWSPDGRRIVFNRAEGDVVKGSIARSWLEVMNSDGSHVRDFLPRPTPRKHEDGNAAWTRSGWVAFTRLNDSDAPINTHAIFAVRADGTGLRRLTPWALQGGDPAISRDGRTVVFHDAADVDLNDPGQQSADLYTVALAGGAPRQLTHNPAGTRYGVAAFSPDDRYLVTARYPGLTSTQPDLFLIDLATGEGRAITHDDLWQSQPDWTPIS